MILTRTYIDAIRRLLMQTAVAVMALVALSIVGACSSDVAGDEPCDVPREPVYKAGFYVTTGDLRLSRAPVPGDYEAGTPLENYIDMDGKDFRIFMFDENDTYVGQLDDIMIRQTSSDGTFKTYLVSGVIPAAVPRELGGKLKVMMLANWRHTYPEPVAGRTTLAEIATDAASMQEFIYPDDTQVGTDRLIPMFGITNLLTGLKFDPGWSTDLGTIHMLRAYAQVRVCAHAESLPITSVRLTKANKHLFRAPVGVGAQSDYVFDSYAKDYYRKPSVPSGTASVAEPVALAEKDGMWRIYIPEFANLADPQNPQAPLAAGERCRIEVMFDGDVTTHYIDFKYYDDPPEYAGDAKKGDHFDILRNNIYEYTLKRLGGESDVKVEVDVIPYSEVVLKPEFGFDRDNVTGWIILKGYSQTYYYDDKRDRYYDADKQPVAKRVEYSVEDELYLVRDPRTKKVRYCYDFGKRLYWIDRNRTTPFTTVDQYASYLPSGTVDNGWEVLVMWVDKYGRAIMVYRPADGKAYDKYLLERSPIPNYGFKHWDKNDTYMVIDYDYDGNPEFFYDTATGLYYCNTATEGDAVLKEISAFPPNP